MASAVGMPGARHPPHSPGRAVFPQPVPRVDSLPRQVASQAHTLRCLPSVMRRHALGTASRIWVKRAQRKLRRFPPAPRAQAGSWHKRPGGVSPRDPGCRAASLGHLPWACRVAASPSRGTAAAAAAPPMPRQVPATSRHPPRWPPPEAGRPSRPPGTRRSGSGRGPDRGAACRLSPGLLGPAGR